MPIAGFEMKISNRFSLKWLKRRGWLVLGIALIALLVWLEWLGSEQPVKMMEVPIQETPAKPVSR